MKPISPAFPLLMIGMICVGAGPAFADVSNEVIVGIEGDSSTEVTQSGGGVTIDLSDTYKTSNSLFVLQYTRFFEPLRDDDSPIELRRFLQHPSTLSVGLVGIGQTVEDTRTPGTRKEVTGSASELVFGGEYYFPSDTGLFLNIGLGSGTLKDSVNGADQPERNVDLSTYAAGLRQYVAPSAELHLIFRGEKIHTYIEDAAPASDRDTKKNVVLLGVQGVIQETVGLSFEFGGGTRTDTQTGLPDEEFDVGEMNFAIAAYAGNQLSFRLDLEAEALTQTGLPSGLEYSETTAEARLSVTYWFSERFGMQLPIYSKSQETKTVTWGSEDKLTEKNSGIGLYAGFRF